MAQLANVLIRPPRPPRRPPRRLWRSASSRRYAGATANDLTQTFAYNPASQIASVTRSNDLYAWTGHFNQNDPSTANGLNQVGNLGSKTITHDTKGNITAVGTQTYAYTSENLLAAASGGVTAYYDHLSRLVEYDTNISTRFVYEGAAIAAEVDNPAGAIQHRYVRGDGMDELLVDYAGAGTTGRRFLSTDERGTIIATTDSNGAVLGINKYDEYGVPQAGNLGRFGYTGQAWMPEVGLWYYKARFYRPDIGRFMQTDPIGYEAGLNLYAYVGNDPVNWTDPLGLVGQHSCRWAQVGFSSWKLLCTVDTTTSPPHLDRGGGGREGGGGGGGGDGERTPPQTCPPGDGQTRRATSPQTSTTTAPTTSLLRSVLSVSRASIVGILGSLLGGSTPQPLRFRHYGFSKDAGSFAGGLRPGSFATTAAGPPMTGIQAQALLALPHAQPPNAYYNVTVQIHIPVIGPNPVDPQFGQPGGGVQYQFPRGTPPGSVGPPNPIPRC